MVSEEHISSPSASPVHLSKSQQYANSLLSRPSPLAARSPMLKAADSKVVADVYTHYCGLVYQSVLASVKLSLNELLRCVVTKEIDYR